MGTFTKQQVFPYSFKTVAVADRAAISFTNLGAGTGYNLIGLEIILPKDFYSCEGLYAHFRFVHTSTGRNIRNVIVADSTTSPTVTKSISTNYTYDGSLVNDVKVDLTAIRNSTGTNIVLFDFDGAASGTIKLFKLDMLYQVVGIR